MKKRVMILDDEANLRGLLKMIVEWEELGLELAGEAASGVEAINKIDDIRPHIAIVDIMMPFMNGLEFSKLALERYPQMKIIILTAYEDFNYAKECINLGVADYLVKPINRMDMDNTLRRVIAMLPNEEDEEIEEPPKHIPPPGIMGQIKQFLEQQYQDQSMNLTSVAQEFGFHPSYLSRRFREEVGRSLIDYLTWYRMEKAAELARQGELMYIAAEKTGITDPNYFGRCFKKYQGVSYSEYMKKNGR